MVYYILYYTCLAAFFAGLLSAFLFLRVTWDRPVLTGNYSYLRFAPALSYRPMINARKSLVKFATTDSQQYLIYVENLNLLLERYKPKVYNSVDAKGAVDAMKNFAECKDGVKTPDDPKMVCLFSLSNLGTCTADSNYGYPDGKPCAVIKINKIFGWLPDIADKSVNMNALVNCSGRHPADKENIGKLSYHPGVTIDGKSYGVFDNSYFPFIGQSGYLSPLVAVKFENPKRHVAILVACHLRNLRNSDTESMNFELLVD